MTEIKVESVSVRWLLEALRKRAFGFLLLFLAIPNIIPMPPGLSTIFGILLLFPAIALTLAVIAFNLFGDGLRDALDPRLER